MYGHRAYSAQTSCFLRNVSSLSRAHLHTISLSYLFYHTRVLDFLLRQSAGNPTHATIDSPSNLRKHPRVRHPNSSTLVKYFMMLTLAKTIYERSKNLFISFRILPSSYFTSQKMVFLQLFSSTTVRDPQIFSYFIFEEIRTNNP